MMTLKDFAKVGFMSSEQQEKQSAKLGIFVIFSTIKIEFQSFSCFCWGLKLIKTQSLFDTKSLMRFERICIREVGCKNIACVCCFPHVPMCIHMFSYHSLHIMNQ